MIRRIHQRAGAILLGLLAFVSLTGAAQTVAYVTRSEMEGYVWGVLLSAGVGTVLIGAGLLAWIMSRDRALQQSSIDLVIAATERLADQIENAVGMLAAHNGDALAHTAASEHNHAPILAQLDRIETQGQTTAAALHDLRRDHDRINAMCAQRRDPEDSPYPKRASDRDVIDPATGEPFVRQ